MRDGASVEPALAPALPFAAHHQLLELRTGSQPAFLAGDYHLQIANSQCNPNLQVATSSEGLSAVYAVLGRRRARILRVSATCWCCLVLGCVAAAAMLPLPDGLPQGACTLMRGRMAHGAPRCMLGCIAKCLTKCLALKTMLCRRRCGRAAICSPCTPTCRPRRRLVSPTSCGGGPAARPQPASC